ncbi:MAG: hypothetical protein QF464_23610, partial [Myxococcota bacterium]|nr:hypothetical protein [Myxococcota bacterium]
QFAAWERRINDCYLFRGHPLGRAIGELAHTAGSSRGERLTLRLVEGARFHDGVPITAEHVLASIRRAARGASPLRGAFALLNVRVEAPHVVSIAAPRGITARTLRRLLAHPDLPIRTRTSRCGPFARTGPAALETATYQAHVGHPRGRPWLDAVQLIIAESQQRSVDYLVDGDAEATTTPSHRYSKKARATQTRWSTIVAIPGPAWRGGPRAAMRRGAATLMRRRDFAAHMDGASRVALNLLPPDLAPKHQTRGHDAPAVALGGELRLAFPANRPDLEEIASVLRDRLAPEVSGIARVVPQPGLDLKMAVTGRRTWDLALVEVEWSALDAPQAALEASIRLALPRVSPQ